MSTISRRIYILHLMQPRVWPTNLPHKFVPTFPIEMLGPNKIDQ